MKPKANMEAYIHALENLDLDKMYKMACSLANVVENNGRIFVAGNGGSHAIAQHFASDLMKPVGKEELCCHVECLSNNIALITALGNDVNYESIFSAQLKAHGSVGDMVVAFSVSGTSPNILKLQRVADIMPDITFGFIFGHARGARKLMIGPMTEWTRMSVSTELPGDTALHYYVCESVFSTVAHEIARLFHTKRGNYRA